MCLHNYPATVIGFEEVEYEVDEDDGSVSVVVTVIEGTLSEPVSVRLTTEDNTATRLGTLYPLPLLIMHNY